MLEIMRQGDKQNRVLEIVVDRENVAGMSSAYYTDRPTKTKMSDKRISRSRRSYRACRLRSRLHYRTPVSESQFVAELAVLVELHDNRAVSRTRIFWTRCFSAFSRRCRTLIRRTRTTLGRCE